MRSINSLTLAQVRFSSQMTQVSFVLLPKNFWALKSCEFEDFWFKYCVLDYQPAWGDFCLGPGFADSGKCVSIPGPGAVLPGLVLSNRGCRSYSGGCRVQPWAVKAQGKCRGEPLVAIGFLPVESPWKLREWNFSVISHILFYLGGQWEM